MFPILSPAHTVEEVEYQDDYHDHEDHGSDHHVELDGVLVEQGGTGLQLPVLSGLLLEVEVDIAVIVALLLVIECRIDQAESLPDGSHQIGSRLDGLVGLQGTQEAVAGGIVVLDGKIAFRQGTISPGYLVSIAIGNKNIEGTLRQVASQERVWHLLHVQVLDGR